MRNTYPNDDGVCLCGRVIDRSFTVGFCPECRLLPENCRCQSVVGSPRKSKTVEETENET